MSISDERLTRLIAHHTAMSTPGQYTPLASVSDAEAAMLYQELQVYRAQLRNTRTDYCCIHGVKLFDDCNLCPAST